MNDPKTFGGKMFKRFMQKGWRIQFTDEIQDRVAVIPPDRLNANHLFAIYIPVLRHTWQPDMNREWYAAVITDQKVHGPTFEVKAHPDQTAAWVAFATWIGDLVRNPQKFTS